MNIQASQLVQRVWNLLSLVLIFKKPFTFARVAYCFVQPEKYLTQTTKLTFNLHLWDFLILY